MLSTWSFLGNSEWPEQNPKEWFVYTEILFVYRGWGWMWECVWRKGVWIKGDRETLERIFTYYTLQSTRHCDQLAWCVWTLDSLTRFARTKERSYVYCLISFTLIFFFPNTGDWTNVLVLARHILYHLSYTFSLFGERLMFFAWTAIFLRMPPPMCDYRSMTPFLAYWLRLGLAKFLPGFPLNLDPPNLCLPSS
jgi:hypothetical protein